ncbi:Chromate resistance protein ChrB [Microbacterium sp. NPDC055903]
MSEIIDWVLAVVQVPSAPSRHRVAVWRELRRAGAVPVSQGTWALPGSEPFRPALARAGALASEGGGSIAVFDVHPVDDEARALIEDAYRSARADEWREFIADTEKYTDEIAREIATEKFTFAELEEEEQSLDRLRRWHREIRRRDVLLLAEASAAADRLRACSDALDDFAERVYAATRGLSASGD